MNINKPHKKDS